MANVALCFLRLARFTPTLYAAVAFCLPTFSAAEPPLGPAQHWAFRPLADVAPPAVGRADWSITPVDAFVLSRLEQAGLAPSAPADPRTLLRRLSFDLTGLPPAFDEVQALAADPSPAAYAQAVERFLAAPQFGERWARHWLDLSRYADTKGYVFQEDREYAQAWRYRDWLVAAINADLPYDQFVTLQLAADRVLPAGQTAGLEALGFLTLGRRFLNNRHDIIDDRIDVVSRGLLGLTLGCARCHDHKYDPLSMADYYALYGVFASSQETTDAEVTIALRDADQLVQPRIFLRGSPHNPGDEVPRRFVALLAPQQKPFEQGSGRLELAQAIVRPDNPLTARVFVNRVWSHLVGAPLVATPSDFGLRTDPPTHPQLLDWLARDFIAQGWSLKQLVRQIVLSQTYRQSSLPRPDAVAVDPENRLLARMHRKRLEWEPLRDALLSAGGRLDLTVGGPAVDLFATPFPARRSLYGRIDRQNLPGVFRIFDLASPDVHAPQRFQTTIPQQALFLLNHPFALEQAHALAVAAVAENEAARVAAIYRRALQRDPSPRELELALAFVAAASAEATSGDAALAWDQLAQAALLSNEFAFVD